MRHKVKESYLSLPDKGHSFKEVKMERKLYREMRTVKIKKYGEVFWKQYN